MLFRMAVVVLALSALFAAACGSDDDDDNSGEPTANGDNADTLLTPGIAPTSATIQGTPAAPQSTPAPPYAIDAANTPLVQLDSPRLYQISYPEGWTVDTSQPSFDEITLRRANGSLVSRISAYCATALGTGDPAALALLRQDADAIRDFPIENNPVSQITLDGKNAYRWHYSVSTGAGGPKVYQWVYYIDDVDCGWRLRMIVYGTDPVVGWEELFDRIAATFHSTRPG